MAITGQGLAGVQPAPQGVDPALMAQLTQQQQAQIAALNQPAQSGVAQNQPPAPAPKIMQKDGQMQAGGAAAGAAVGTAIMPGVGTAIGAAVGGAAGGMADGDGGGGMTESDKNMRAKRANSADVGQFVQSGGGLGAQVKYLAGGELSPTEQMSFIPGTPANQLSWQINPLGNAAGLLALSPLVLMKFLTSDAGQGMSKNAGLPDWKNNKNNLEKKNKSGGLGGY